MRNDVAFLFYVRFPIGVIIDSAHSRIYQKRPFFCNDRCNSLPIKENEETHSYILLSKEADSYTTITKTGSIWWSLKNKKKKCD